MFSENVTRFIRHLMIHCEDPKGKGKANQPLVGLFCFSVCMGFWAERAALGEMG